MFGKRRSKRLRLKETSITPRRVAPYSTPVQAVTATRVISESHDAPQTLIGRTSSSASLTNWGEPFMTDDIPTKEFYSMELANELIKQSRFKEAIQLIAKLPVESERRRLMMSECYLQLAEFLEATRSIDRLGQVMTSQQENLKVVMKLIDEYVRTKSFVRALVLLSCASKLYKDDLESKIAIEGIRVCSSKLSIDVFPALANGGDNFHNIAKNVGLEMICNMLADMKSVPCTDGALEAKNEARCIYNIGRCYNGLKNYQKSIQSYEQGISVMEKQYIQPAKYQIYGDLLYHLGMTYKSLEKYENAKKYFIDARDSYEEAENWQSDEAAQKYKELVNNKLEEVGSILRSQ